MLKKITNSVLGETESSTCLEGSTPAVQSRLRPRWMIFLSILLLSGLGTAFRVSGLRSNVEVLFDADVALSSIAQNRDDVLTGAQFFRYLLGRKDIGSR